MEKYQIVLEIMGRKFPVNVTQADEPRIRLVAQYVEDKVTGYRQRYTGLQDEALLALMACMDITAEYLKATETQENEQSSLTEQLEQLNLQIEQTLHSHS